jgi:hypothetical protein
MSLVMNRHLCLFACALVTSTTMGQIDVKLSTTQEQFLPAERLEVAVKISNFTGGPLRLGSHPQWIAFNVQRADGGVVNKITNVPETGEFTLEQSTSGTLRFDLAPQFAIDRPDRYRVTATVTPVASGETYVSAPLAFDIISGVRLNEDRTFGFVKTDGSVEQRKYILQQANFLKHLRLYLRVTDATESRSFKVVPLGGVVTFNPPRWGMDRQSYFHVLHQFSADEYRYHRIDPDGNLLTLQTWRATSRRPELRVNDSGEIAVVGGVRLLDRTDIPATTDAELAAARRALRPSVPSESTDSTATTNAPPKDRKR